MKIEENTKMIGNIESCMTEKNELREIGKTVTEMKSILSRGKYILKCYRKKLSIHAFFISTNNFETRVAGA